MAKKLYVQEGKSCTTNGKGILSPGTEVKAEYFEYPGCEKGHGVKMLERLYKKEVIGDKNPDAKVKPKLEKSEDSKGDDKKDDDKKE